MRSLYTKTACSDSLVLETPVGLKHVSPPANIPARLSKSKIPIPSLPSILQASTPSSYKQPLLPIRLLLLIVSLLFFRTPRRPTGRSTDKIITRITTGLALLILGSASLCIRRSEL